MAFIDRLEGRYDAALSRCRMALSAFQEAGDSIGEAHMLRNIAQIHTDRQNYDTAQQLLDEALTVCRKLGARRVIAQTEHELAKLYMHIGRLEKAEQSFRSARTAAHAGGDVIGDAYALLGLGAVGLEQGKLVQAEADIHAALDTANRTGDLLIQGRVILILAELHFARNDLGAAMANADEALRTLNELGSAAVWRARVLELLGRIHARQDRVDDARRAWHAAGALLGDADPVLAGRLAAELARIGAEPRAD